MLDPYQRGDGSLNRAFPSRSDDSGPLCCVCGDPLAGRRRRYCGDVCAQEAAIRSGNTAAIRLAVEERDAGICALCGLDTVDLADMLLSLRRGVRPPRARFFPWGEEAGPLESALFASVEIRPNALSELTRKIHKAALRRMDRIGFDTGISFWQADHIVPVSEGGGGCDLDGFRTLCVACHKPVTAALAARTAAARSPQMSLFRGSA